MVSGREAKVKTKLEVVQKVVTVFLLLRGAMLLVWVSEDRQDLRYAQAYIDLMYDVNVDGISDLEAFANCRYHRLRLFFLRVDDDFGQS